LVFNFIKDRHPIGRNKGMKSLSIFAIALLLFRAAEGQYVEKVSFDAADSTNGYYLAIPPTSQTIRGVLVFFCTFRSPESLLPETRLHNIAAAGDLLTIYASLGRQLLPDTATIGRVNRVLQHVAGKYAVDTASFVLGGFDDAGIVVLRYTEMAYENPGRFSLRPRAVFAVASTVDLTGLYRVSERVIKSNYFPPAVNDARFYLDALNKEYGSPKDHPERYREASPFVSEGEAPGNEQYLRQIPIRLYYDGDIGWQLSARRKSLYDTNIPDGTELINRLLLAGNKQAEFIASRSPGVRSNGARNATAMSIVDETDCILWIKRVLHILDPSNPQAWSAPYKFPQPDGWNMEQSYVPGPNSVHLGLRAIEDIRFPPGWGVAGSEEYWSVAYLFWLDGGQKIDANVLQRNLKIYYDDLIAGALIRRNISVPPGTVKPVQVTIQKLKAEPDDLETYTGTIAMFDYMGKKPMTLNYLVHLKSCADPGHVPLFLEISPQPFGHPLWAKLKEVKQKFVCVP
jgi:hypothetical protein